MPENNPNTRKCGAKSRQGTGACQHEAGWGTSHPGFGSCKQHGGSTRAGTVRAVKDEMSQRAVPMGTPIETDPFDALLKCIWISAGEVQYCSERIAELDPTEVLVRFSESQVGDQISYVKTSTEVQLHAWIIARRHALDALARYSKMAIDAGVAERQVALAERVGGMIGSLVSAVLGELGLDDRQQAIAPEVVRRHLTQIAAESAVRN